MGFFLTAFLICGVTALYLWAHTTVGLEFEKPEFHHAHHVCEVKFSG